MSRWHRRVARMPAKRSASETSRLKSRGGSLPDHILTIAKTTSSLWISARHNSGFLRRGVGRKSVSSYWFSPPRLAAQRFRCASAIRFRASSLTTRFFPVSDSGAAPTICSDSHFGGRPLRLPDPLASRSRAIIASSSISRSVRSCASSASKSILICTSVPYHLSYGQPSSVFPLLHGIDKHYL